jgi:hypothetical protein
MVIDPHRDIGEEDLLSTADPRAVMLSMFRRTKAVGCRFRRARSGGGGLVPRTGCLTFPAGVPGRVTV